MDLVTEVMRRKNEGEKIAAIAKELEIGTGKAAMAVLAAQSAPKPTIAVLQGRAACPVRVRQRGS